MTSTGTALTFAAILTAVAIVDWRIAAALSVVLLFGVVIAALILGTIKHQQQQPRHRRCR